MRLGGKCVVITSGGIVNLDGGFDSVGPIFGVDELRSLKSDARDAERND